MGFFHVQGGAGGAPVGGVKGCPSDEFRWGEYCVCPFHVFLWENLFFPVTAAEPADFVADLFEYDEHADKTPIA